MRPLPLTGRPFSRKSLAFSSDRSISYSPARPDQIDGPAGPPTWVTGMSESRPMRCGMFITSQRDIRCGSVLTTIPSRSSSPSTFLTRSTGSASTTSPAASMPNPRRRSTSCSSRPSASRRAMLCRSELKGLFPDSPVAATPRYRSPAQATEGCTAHLRLFRAASRSASRHPASGWPPQGNAERRTLHSALPPTRLAPPALWRVEPPPRCAAGGPAYAPRAGATTTPSRRKPQWTLRALVAERHVNLRSDPLQPHERDCHINAPAGQALTAMQHAVRLAPPDCWPSARLTSRSRTSSSGSRPIPGWRLETIKHGLRHQIVPPGVTLSRADEGYVPPALADPF